MTGDLMSADEADGDSPGHGSPMDIDAEAEPGLFDAPDDDVTEAPTGRAARRRAQRSAVVRRSLVSVGVLAVVLALVIVGGVWFLTQRYAGNIDRISNVFAGIDQSARPAPATSATDPGADPITFLLVGSDTR